jgi:hypothetical protein
MGFIAVPAGTKGMVGCKTDQDCYTAMKITTPEKKAETCCSYVGIDKMSDNLSALMKLVAASAKMPILE